MSQPPILDNKDQNAPSVFEPAALLREARRQKGLSPAGVPAVCILDPDGDIVRRLKQTDQAEQSSAWPCYHTDLYTFELAGKTVGIVGCAVGAPAPRIIPCISIPAGQIANIDLSIVAPLVNKTRNGKLNL